VRYGTVSGTYNFTYHPKSNWSGYDGNSEYTKSHSASLTGLTKGTDYYYKCYCLDAVGGWAESSTEGTFSTGGVAAQLTVYVNTPTDDLDYFDGQLMTLKKNTVSYNTRGEPTHSWATNTTAWVDLQPNRNQNAVITESGLKVVFPFAIYAWHDTDDVAVAAAVGDRWYSSDNIVYEIKYIEQWATYHFKYYCINVTGQL
jgi:hypothetical protein